MSEYEGADNCEDCIKTTEPHTCPYAEEINDDYETMCTCCKECEYQCSMDI